MDNLIDYSSSGRMRDQDSKPPTAKQRNMTLENPTGLVTIQDFFTESNGPSTEADDDPSIGKMTGMASKSEEEKKQGTFQKIAGLVRRSGLGLYIKSPTEGERSTAAVLISDLSNWSYVAEHQENLLAVQIMLSGVSLSLKDDLIIETEQNVQPGCGVSEAVIMSKRDASISMCITLPTPVAIGQTIPFKQSDLHVEAKLSALATAPNGAISSLNTILQHPLSAPELRKIQPKALCCTACNREVADLSRTLRSEEKFEGSGFKDLPSEHWAEMLEVWMCHDDPAFTAQLAQRTNEGFWPSKDTVLVGGSYLLVHQDEGKSANLQVDPDNVSSPASAPSIPTTPQHMLYGLQEGLRHSPTGGLAFRPCRSPLSPLEAPASSFATTGDGRREGESDRVTPLTDTTVQERHSHSERDGGHGFNPLS